MILRDIVYKNFQHFQKTSLENLDFLIFLNSNLNRIWSNCKMIPGLLQFYLCKKMLLFFYSVLCKPCKWCAIKTIYKQKDVHTELFKADSFAGKYNITECSVCFSVVEFQNFPQFWNSTTVSYFTTLTFRGTFSK